MNPSDLQETLEQSLQEALASGQFDDLNEEEKQFVIEQMHAFQMDVAVNMGDCVAMLREVFMEVGVDLTETTQREKNMLVAFSDMIGDLAVQLPLMVKEHAVQRLINTISLTALGFRELAGSKPSGPGHIFVADCGRD